MLDKIKKTLVKDLGFEVQVGEVDTGIVDENGNFAEPSPYRKLLSILLMSSIRWDLFSYIFRWSEPILDKLDNKWMAKHHLRWTEDVEDSNRNLNTA